MPLRGPSTPVLQKIFNSTRIRLACSRVHVLPGPAEFWLGDAFHSDMRLEEQDAALCLSFASKEPQNPYMVCGTTFSLRSCILTKAILQQVLASQVTEDKRTMDLDDARWHPRERRERTTTTVHQVNAVRVRAFPCSDWMTTHLCIWCRPQCPRIALLPHHQ